MKSANGGTRFAPLKASQVEEIRDRLRELKENSRETTRTIGDYVGVDPRSVADWLSPSKPKPPTYEHIEKVAELFGVDPGWLWRGDRSAYDGSMKDQLNRIEKAVQGLSALIAPIAASLVVDDAARGISEPRKRTARARAPSEKASPKRAAAKQRAG